MKQKLVNWRDYSWSFVRKYILSYGLGLIAKSVTGPWGWIATKVLPIIIDQFAKPMWLWATRKVVLAKDTIRGGKTARSKREATTPDDYLDSLNSDK